jgi:hypothetical protein
VTPLCMCRMFKDALHSLYQNRGLLRVRTQVGCPRTRPVPAHEAQEQACGAAAAPGWRCPAAAGSGGSPGIMPGPPDAAECALSAQVVARRRRSTARTAAAAPSCSAAWQLLHGMLGRAKLLGMVQGSSSSAAAVPEMRFVLSMSHAPHGCRTMWSLTGYIRQLFACLGGRIAGDPLRKDEVCT